MVGIGVALIMRDEERVDRNNRVIAWEVVKILGLGVCGDSTSIAMEEKSE